MLTKNPHLFFQVLYILQLYQDTESGLAHISSISEFLLAQPCLSFAILDASRRKFKKSTDAVDNLLGDITTGEVNILVNFFTPAFHKECRAWHHVVARVHYVDCCLVKGTT